MSFNNYESSAEFRLQIEDYMEYVLGYSHDQILQKDWLTDRQLLEQVQQDLKDQPDDFWPDGVRLSARQEVINFNKSGAR